jgi:hypothetical protein
MCYRVEQRRPIAFLPRFGEQKRRNILRSLLVKPVGPPEAGLGPIAQSDACAACEEDSISVVAGYLCSHPGLLRGSPLMLEPAETQGSRELLQVEDPETTEVFRECGSRPVDFTFAA